MADPFWYKLRKSEEDKLLFGVCGGLGKATGIPSWVWRVIFVLCLFSYGLGVILYVLLVIFMPGQD